MARRGARPIAGGVGTWLAATLWPRVYHDAEILVEPLAILGASLPDLPVLLRYHAVSGAWTLQTNSGLDFNLGNDRGADGRPNIHAGRPWARLVAMAPERGIKLPAAQDAFYRGVLR